MIKSLRVGLMMGSSLGLLHGAAPDFSSVKAVVEAGMRATQTPSMAVAVASEGKILWEEGFGFADAERKIAATPHTLYYSASVTKAFTATALMRLHEQGKLDLDRPVNDYLPGAKLHSPRWDVAEATVRTVALQTAGLTTYDRSYVAGSAQERLTADQMIERYGVVFWPPGDRFDYSNVGYGVLGEVIAHVSGEPLAEFMRKEIFAPLGMRRTRIGAGGLDEVAARYSTLHHGFNPPTEPSTPAGSGAYTSAHELALFGLALVGTPLPEQRPVLSAKSIDGLADPSVDAGGGDRHSLAWWIKADRNGYRTLTAQGGTYDAQAWLVLVPSERIAITLLGNSGMTPADKPIDAMLALLLPQFRENKARKEARASLAATGQTSQAPTSEWEGTWSGEIRAGTENIPVRLDVLPTQGVRVSVREQVAEARNVRLQADRLTARFSADVAVGDTDGIPYGLSLELYRDNNRATGAVVTTPVAGREGPRLPFWIEVRRQ